MRCSARHHPSARQADVRTSPESAEPPSVYLEITDENMAAYAGDIGDQAVLPMTTTGGRSVSMLFLQTLRALLLATILAGALAGRAAAQAPGARCPLPSEPEGIPAA